MQDWAGLQKDLYNQLRRELNTRLSKKPKSLQAYQRAYRNDMRHLKESSRARLTAQMNRADICFIGDFHTLRQSQKMLLRLLREREIHSPEFLAFEVLSPTHEKLIQRWMKSPSQKNQAALQEKLELERNWGTSFDIYLEIFKFCREHKINVKGLHLPKANLKKRDKFAAQIIASLPQKTWVFFGEHHCARPHLPKLVYEINPELAMLVIQQNDDEIMLGRLADPSFRKTRILQSKDKQEISLFCLLHTPIWVKWQSYLNHYVHSESETPQIDAHDQVRWSLRTLIDFFNDKRYPLPAKPEDLMDISVYQPEDEDFVDSLSTFSMRRKKQILNSLRLHQMAILPEARKIYITEITVNTCAQAAGAYLYRKWAGIEKLPEGFYSQALLEAVSYFLSKVLNHSRQTLRWRDWEHQARRKAAQKAKAVLKTRNFSENYSDKFIKSLGKHKTESAKALARIIADSAFEAFLVGELSHNRVLRILSEPIMSETAAFEVLVELKAVGHPFRSHEPRGW